MKSVDQLNANIIINPIDMSSRFGAHQAINLSHWLRLYLSWNQKSCIEDGASFPVSTHSRKTGS